ncbi:uncharacterized protein [Venturia canescens]|uniref:uncharacterized protein n=1 Tax=Venturia canescens TaxID=32260 RepID=UPI001C9CA74C|nr:uncharacterized protein LOC122411716 [Venturia canescens]
MIEFVFSQLLSAGYGAEAQLIKISAIFEENEFSMWIKPSKSSLDTERSGVPGLECQNYRYFVDGKLQEPILSIQEVLKRFREFLMQVKKFADSPVTIAAHNAKREFELLIDAIKKTGMAKAFDGIIFGFVDTLPPIQIDLADDPSIKTFTLAALARHLLGKTYSGRVHIASEYLRLLREIIMGNIDPYIIAESIERYHNAILGVKTVQQGTSNQFGFDDEDGPSGTEPPVQYRNASGRRGSRNWVNKRRGRYGFDFDRRTELQ